MSLAERVLRNIPTADAREQAAKREVLQRCPCLTAFIRHTNGVFGQVALIHADDGTGWQYGERTTGWVRLSDKPLEAKRGRKHGLAVVDVVRTVLL